MANKIQAIKKYCPTVVLGKTIQLKELVSYIADRTGLNKGDIQISLSELSAAIQFFNKQGQGVKLEGLGTYQPKIDLKGKFSVLHRLDKEIENVLNTPGAFSGDIINKEYIGKTSDELVAKWNEDNPTDLIE